MLMLLAQGESVIQLAGPGLQQQHAKCQIVACHFGGSSNEFIELCGRDDFCACVADANLESKNK